MKKKDTIEQRRAIYCVRHGHSRVVTLCFGEVGCARCENRIGDTLMSTFDMSDVVILGHDCERCRRNAAKLTREDLALLPPETRAKVDALRKATA